jgi:hypothetical protein
MIYQLKTRKYNRNAKQILEITPCVTNGPVEYIGEAMVFDRDLCANGDLWDCSGELLFSTCDDMCDLMKNKGVLLVTS